MFLSNLIYASMELFPSNRRYIMFASRLLIGVASGDIAALRAYCASAAVPKDRSRAVVLTSAAWVLIYKFIAYSKMFRAVA